MKMKVYLNGYHEADIEVDSNTTVHALRDEFAAFLSYELDREVDASELFYEEHQGWILKVGSTEYSLEED